MQSALQKVQGHLRHQNRQLSAPTGPAAKRSSASKARIAAAAAAAAVAAAAAATGPGDTALRMLYGRGRGARACLARIAPPAPPDQDMPAPGMDRTPAAALPRLQIKQEEQQLPPSEADTDQDQVCPNHAMQAV